MHKIQDKHSSEIDVSKQGYLPTEIVKALPYKSPFTILKKDL